MRKYFKVIFILVILLFICSCKEEMELATYGKRDEPKNFTEDALSWTFKGLDKADLGSFKDALECFDKALDLHPTCVYTINCRGLTFLSMKKREEAMKCFDQAIEINPEYGPSYINKGNAFITEKKYEEALYCFTALTEIDHSNPLPWNSKGVIFMRIFKDPKEAEKCFDKALEIDPQYKPALINKEMIARGGVTEETGGETEDIKYEE